MWLWYKNTISTMKAKFYHSLLWSMVIITIKIAINLQDEFRICTLNL